MGLGYNKYNRYDDRKLEQNMKALSDYEPIIYQYITVYSTQKIERNIHNVTIVRVWTWYLSKDDYIQ